jgi:hypothetical protein
VNFIEAVDIFEASATTLIRDTLAADARPVIQATLAAYAQLAPDWTQAPEWAQWCAIDAGGDQCWYAGEPHAGDGANAWMSADGQYEVCRELSIPIGIDWRLCKWQRP